MNPIKKYGLWVLVAMALVAIFQNAGAVTIKFLVWDVSMSKAILLPIVLLIGFLIGWLVSEIQRKRE